MRMWMVNPKVLCRQHLLGEHLENHMLIGTVRKGMSIDGYVYGGLAEPLEIQQRHDALVKEMEHRGYNHQSPLRVTEEMYAGFLQRYGAVLSYVDVEENLKELARRCTECAGLQNKPKE